MLLTVLAALLLSTAPITGAVAATQGLPTATGTLSARIWRTVHLTSTPRLIIVLHGDLESPRDDYQYAFASSVAKRLDDTIVIAPLRPGYVDGYGARSHGRRGWADGDNYTPEVIARVSDFIRSEAATYKARSVTLVGHSGGAAIAADLLEDYPDLASGLLLVSCPCDVGKWRLHMALRQLNPVWLLPVGSESPVDRARRLSSRLRLRVIVGEKDSVAPARLSIAFAQAARSANVQVVPVILKDAGHNVLLDGRVLQQLLMLQAVL